MKKYLLLIACLVVLNAVLVHAQSNRPRYEQLKPIGIADLSVNGTSGQVIAVGSDGTTLIYKDVPTFSASTLDAASLGQLLRFNGSDWENWTPTYLPLSGGTMTGKIITLTSATGSAGLNLPHGVAPTSPVNGDIWTTSSGLFARISNTTVAIGAGSVTSVTAGSGMSFTDITSTGSVTLGTPSSLTDATSNSVSGTTHTHAVTTVLPSSATSGIMKASGTKAGGGFYGGTTAPDNTTRLNYDGYLYATGFYGDGSGLTSLSASSLPTSIDAAKIADGNVSNTEFQYLDGVSSSIQAQLTAKLPLAGGTMTGNLKLVAGTNALAPLTFQSGTNLNTLVSGAMEFDGTNLYISTGSSTVTRQKIALVSGSSTYNSAVMNKGTVPGISSGTAAPSSGNESGDLFWNTSDNTLSRYNGSVWNGLSASSAAKLATARSIYGNSFDGSASITGSISVSYGGTGLTSYTIGDLLYASASGTLSALPAVATGYVLSSNGVGVAPSWKTFDSAIGSTILPVANGGTGKASVTSKALLLGNGTSALTEITKPTVASTQVLVASSTVDPSWGATVTMSGDVSIDNTGVATVSGISGKSISGTLSSGNILKYNGTNWVPSDPTATYSFSNGLTLNSGAVKLGGSLTAATTVTMGANDIIWDATSSSGSFNVNVGSGVFQVMNSTGSNYFKVGSGGSGYFTGSLQVDNGLAVTGNSTFVNDLTVNGTFSSPSDKRLKKNIETLTGVLYKINQIRGVSFEFIDQTKYASGSQMGLIAQELQTVYPELVAKGDDGFLKVDYTHLTAILLQAIKEQQTQIETMQTRLKEQEERLNAQQKQIDEIKALMNK